MIELKVGDLITLGDAKYKIAFFHKGVGSSEITARLIGDNGEKRDVLKRILIEEITNKKKEYHNTESKDDNFEEKNYRITISRENKNKKYNKGEK